jgi:hypothetical protein
MPIRKVLSQGKAPVKIDTDEVAENAQVQLANIASLPFVHHQMTKGRRGAGRDPTVMANPTDLVEVVHTLKQVLCVKG